MERKRLEYVDMVKGAAILGVVVMHSETAPVWVVCWIASFVLPFFFMISGVLIGYGKEKDKGMKEILCRKGRSLMLPFLWFSLIFILMEFRRMITGNSDWEAMRAGILSLVTLKGSSVLWFLPAMFIAESIFIFLLKKFPAAGVCIISLALTVVSYMTNNALLRQEAVWAATPGLSAAVDFLRTFLRAVCALPFFCVGYYVFENFRIFREAERKFSAGRMAGGIFLFLSGVPLGVMNGLFDFRTMQFGNIPVLAYAYASLSFFGFVLICKNCRPFRMLTYFGKNSLIVMATHIDFYIIYAAHRVAYKANEYIPRLNRVFFFVNVIAVTMILEVICITIINRFFPFLIGKKYDKMD